MSLLDKISYPDDPKRVHSVADPFRFKTTVMNVQRLQNKIEELSFKLSHLATRSHDEWVLVNAEEAWKAFKE